jgi:hypothetical protein
MSFSAQPPIKVMLEVAHDRQSELTEELELQAEVREDPDASAQLSEAGEDQWAAERQRRAQDQARRDAQSRPGLGGLEG